MGDHITLKVPKNTLADHTELLKFQASDENYIEKDFVVSAIVSRCTGETDEFIGSGTDVVSVIMPQQMMESNFDIADYNSLNINLEEDAKSDEVSNKLKNYIVGLNKCVIHDNTTEIEKKNDSIMQKVYFFYGIALILFFISLLHTTNSMNHQIQSRRYELAILRAMGITERGFCKILISEGLFYGVFTSVCMLVLIFISKFILANIMQHILRFIIYITLLSSTDQNRPNTHHSRGITMHRPRPNRACPHQANRGKASTHVIRLSRCFQKRHSVADINPKYGSRDTKPPFTSRFRYSLWALST